MSFVVVVLHNIVVIMDQYFYMVIVFIRMLLMHCIKKTNEYKLNLLQDHTSVYDAKLPV